MGTSPIKGQLTQTIDWEAVTNAKWSYYQLLMYVKLCASNDYQIDFGHWLACVPALHRRMYSIANSSEKEVVEIIVAQSFPSNSVIQSIDGARKSLTADMSVPNPADLFDPAVSCISTKMLFSGRQSISGTLALESQPLPDVDFDSTLILIGTGSGIAPLRRLYLSQLKQGSNNVVGSSKGSKVLLFGNRYLNDGLPALPNEVETLLSHGWTVCLCVSRPNLDGTESKVKLDREITMDGEPRWKTKDYPNNGRLILAEGMYVGEALKKLSDGADSNIKNALLPSNSENQPHNSRIEICGNGDMIDVVIGYIDNIVKAHDEDNTNLSSHSGSERLIQEHRLSFERFD